jgi:hypothetical protein
MIDTVYSFNKNPYSNRREFNPKATITNSPGAHFPKASKTPNNEPSNYMSFSNFNNNTRPSLLAALNTNRAAKLYDGGGSLEKGRKSMNNHPKMDTH